MPQNDIEQSFSVLVLDMAHSHDADGERLVRGFPTVDAARAYAEARIRASVEELRGKNQTADEIRRLWHIYGEDCLVPGDSFRGSNELDLYIAVPASPAECGWPALTPYLKRFHTTLLVTDQDKHSVWVGGLIYRYFRPNRATLMAIFRRQALEAFARDGHSDAEPTELMVANLFELFDVPMPPIGKALKRWRINVDFVCHDIKFGYATSGVFVWPDKPEGTTLNLMANVLVGDALARRGDGPQWAEASDINSVKVEETDREPDYSPYPDETEAPAAG